MPEELPPVRDNPDASRYEMATDDGVAVLKYSRRPSGLLLQHTEVPPAFRGRGYAIALATHALEAARRSHERVIPICPFVKAFIRKHPEYQTLVSAPAGN